MNTKHHKNSGSGLVRLIHRAASGLRHLAGGSLFGRIMTGYDRLDSRFADSAIASAASKTKKLRPLGRVISAQIEGSYFINALKRTAGALLTTKIRTYGWFLFSFGFYSLAVWAIKVYGFAMVSFTVGGIYTPTAIIIASLPLLFSRKTLAEAVRTNRIARFTAIKIFGFRESALDGISGETGRNNMAFLWGLVFGALTYFVTPGTVLMALFFAVLFYIIMSAPEVGVVLIFAVLPFATERTLLTIAGVVSASYILKLIRGKRIMEIHVFDFAVLLFGILRIFGSVVSPLGTTGIAITERTVLCMLLYFVTANLIDTPKLLHRVAVVFISATALSTSIAIFAELFSAKWLGVTALPMIDLSNGIFAGDISESLGLTFGAAAMFGLSFLATSAGAGKKLGYLILVLITLAGVSAVASVPIKVGIAVGIILLLLFFSHKTLIVAIAGAAAAAALCLAFPVSVGRAVTTYFAGISESLAEHGLVRQSSFDLFGKVLLSGVGNDGFGAAYPLFAKTGSEGATDSSNLFLGIGIEVGIAGLILFSVLLLIFSVECITHAAATYSKREKFTVYSGLCTAVAFAVCGFFTNPFSDTRLFLLFWLTLGLTSSYKRLSSNALSREAFRKNDISTASVDLYM